MVRSAHRAHKKCSRSPTSLSGIGSPDGEAHVRARTRATGPAPGHAIPMACAVEFVIGFGPAVRKGEHRASHRHYGRSWHVEGEEPHRPPAECVGDVGPDVDLDEIAEERDRRCGPQLDVAHLERNQPHPRRPVEGVDRDAGGQEALHDRRFVPPMDVGEFGPLLPEDCTMTPGRRVGGDRFDVRRHSGGYSVSNGVPETAGVVWLWPVQCCSSRRWVTERRRLWHATADHVGSDGESIWCPRNGTLRS